MTYDMPCRVQSFLFPSFEEAVRVAEYMERRWPISVTVSVTGPLLTVGTSERLAGTAGTVVRIIHEEVNPK